MGKAFEIGGISVQPGTKAKGMVPITTTMDGQIMGIPFMVVNGVEEGPVLLLDGCVHGDEPEGPLAIIRTIEKLDATKLRGTVVAVPVVNLRAFEAMRRGNPRDELSYDMNRIYPGKKEGHLTERLSWIHYNEFLLKADLELAIHGGGNHSFMCPAIFHAGTEGCLELAKAMGPDWTIVMKSLGNSSPMGAGKEKGIHGLTVEIGGTCGTLAQQFDSSIKVLEKAFLNVMKHYKMIEGKAEYADHWYVGKQDTVFTEADGLIDPTIVSTLGTYITKDTPIVRTINVYGEEVQLAKAPCDGIPFGIRTYPSTTTGDWMVFFGNVKKVDKLTLE